MPGLKCWLNGLNGLMDKILKLVKWIVLSDFMKRTLCLIIRWVVGLT